MGYQVNPHPFWSQPSLPSRTIVLAWRRPSPFRAALQSLVGAMRRPARAPQPRREPTARRAARLVRTDQRVNGGHR
jgi:hypothetical protein